MSFVLTLWFLVIFVFQKRGSGIQTDARGTTNKQGDHDQEMELSTPVGGLEAFQHRDVIPIGERQDLLEHFALKLRVVRLTHGEAEGPRHIEGARHSHLSTDFRDTGRTGGGDACLLERSLNQTDRLGAYGSNRDHEGDVDFICGHHADYFGHGFADESPGGCDGPHDRNVARSDLADHPGVDEFA